MVNKIITLYFAKKLPIELPTLPWARIFVKIELTLILCFCYMSEKQQSFEEQLKALESLTSKLESGELSLFESLETYEKGLQAVQSAQKHLQTQKRKLTFWKQNMLYQDKALKTNNSLTLNCYDIGQMKLFRARTMSLIEKYLTEKQLCSEQKRALCYTLRSGGKSLRATLAYVLAHSLGIHINQVDSIALATELAHSYSLIHDDLPCMDDDNFRRHRPSHHKAFDQAASVLTGDALQAEAFYVISHCNRISTSHKVFCLQQLSKTLSSEHLIQGQWQDLFDRPQTFSDLKLIHQRKPAIFSPLS